MKGLGEQREVVIAQEDERAAASQPAGKYFFAHWRIVLEGRGGLELCSQPLTILTAVNKNDKNNFSLEAKTRLLVLGWSVADLARKIKRPRSSVSVAIHTNKFPEVRTQVAKKLGIELAA